MAKCKTCGSTRKHETMLGCVQHLKSELVIQRHKERKHVDEIASLRARLKVADRPLPGESSDLLRVVQALEERVRVLEAVIK